MNIRWFLTIGMTGSGLLVAAQGLGYYLKMHNFWCGRHVSVLMFTELHSHLLPLPRPPRALVLRYYAGMYAVQGFFQAIGWPSVVAVVGR